METKTRFIGKVQAKDAVLICGLPGIGNVGKIAVDFIIDSLKPKKFAEMHSPSFPHAVFVEEDNMVHLPEVALYHKNIGKRDFLFLAGDVQPIDERSCYDFCERVLDIAQKYGCREIVTMGGIGLGKIPKKPKVFITGNNKKYMKTFKGCNVKIYGIVGPIIGVTGVLVGLAKIRKIPAAILLAQTFGHIAYLGIKGSKEILGVLNERFKLKVNPNKLNEDIELMEEDELMLTQQAGLAKPKKTEVNYFG